MMTKQLPLPPWYPRSSKAPAPARRTSQWALQFGDGGGMPVYPPLRRRGRRRVGHGAKGWVVATALAAVLAVGIAVELLPTRAPEAGALDAAARVVDAAAARMEAAAARLQRPIPGARS